MSKWTIFQLAIAFIFGLLIVLNNVYAEQVSTVFSFISQWIEPSILVIFFTVILIIWGVACILLLQEKKGQPLFAHKAWRIMPAIMGALLFLSAAILLVLGLTVLSNIDRGMHWILDLIVIYFLVVYYYFILSLFVRYSKIKTAQGKVLSSANTAVLILFIVILFLPSLGEIA